jgi:hypothetical protein
MNPHTNRPAPNFRCARAIRLAAALTVALQLAVPTPAAYGYNADDAAHSTFHRDLTRVLALAAGFSDEEAHWLEAITEAVDTGQFIEETDSRHPNPADPKYNIYLSNVKRLNESNQADAQTFFYHWARRPIKFGYTSLKSVEYPYGSGQLFRNAATVNTCSYFNNPPNTSCKAAGQMYASSTPCPGTYKNASEIETLHLWAVEGDPSQIATNVNHPEKTPGYKTDGMADFVEIVSSNTEGSPSPSLVSLGLLLHALGDSYSHEACYIKSCLVGGVGCIRTHPTTTGCPGECVGSWHTGEEFFSPKAVGTGSTAGSGIGITREAANAILRALTNYRRAHGLPVASWDSTQFSLFDFMNYFVRETKSGEERYTYANEQYEKLKQVLAASGGAARRVQRRAPRARARGRRRPR